MDIDILNDLFSKFYYLKANKIRSVGIFLGPYRNLTTYTASLLSLHPQCRVTDPKRDFFINYSKSKENAFIRYALHISKFGKRGEYGGSIKYSHAFKDNTISKNYHEINGSKDLIKSLIWKDSMGVTNYLFEKMENFKKILSDPHNRIRFILPVRNPVYCACSNMKTNHKKHLDIKEGDFEDVFSKIIDIYEIIFQLKKKYPQKILVLFEDEINVSHDDFVNILDIDSSDEWKNLISGISVKNGNYGISLKQIEFYKDIL